MANLMDILEPRDLAKVGKLQLLARRVVEGFCTGLHSSPHKGFSVEFKQHRPYVPGDEIRHIDWKVFGRSDRHYIREYEEETNLRCTLLLDVSGSMAYTGTGGVRKSEYAKRTAACLAYLMMVQQDTVGLVTFDTDVRAFIPPRSRISHLKVMIDTIEASVLGGETAPGAVFHGLVPRLHRRGLIVVISDCFGDVAAMMKAFAHLRHRGHEILVFQVWDRDELEFPFRQWTRFENLEVAHDHHMIDPAVLRSSYLERLGEFRDELRHGCRRHRIDLVPLVTDESYAEALSRYLAFRNR
ncbi:MAG TPA: DUF58 domain-containing protein [Burkholderiales bacterium]|nr:DUF58 domain-containing protein [Burkholderiales bacterium]